MIYGGVFFQPPIESEDLRRRTAHCLHDWFAVAHLVVADRKHRSKDDANAVRGCEIGHRRQIVFNCVESSWTSVAREIVCAGEYHDDLRLEIDHIASKADEHLRCC